MNETIIETAAAQPTVETRPTTERELCIDTTRMVNKIFEANSLWLTVRDANGTATDCQDSGYSDASRSHLDALLSEFLVNLC